MTVNFIMHCIRVVKHALTLCNADLLGEGGPSGCRELFSQVAGHEGDHLPPSSADAKNAWSCTSTALFISVA